MLADKKLPPVYACVQCGHCAVQYVMEHPSGWKNEYLVYLYADLDKWLNRFFELGLDFSLFREPDIGNKITAIATESDGKIFKNLKLIK